MTPNDSEYYVCDAKSYQRKYLVLELLDDTVTEKVGESIFRVQLDDSGMFESMCGMEKGDVDFEFHDTVTKKEFESIRIEEKTKLVLRRE